jgi:hypothetical protein
MALLRPAFAILLALFGTIADAGPQAVPRKYQAGFYLDGSAPQNPRAIGIGEGKRA